MHKMPRSLCHALIGLGILMPFIFVIFVLVAQERKHRTILHVLSPGFFFLIVMLFFFFLNFGAQERSTEEQREPNISCLQLDHPSGAFLQTRDKIVLSLNSA